MPRSSDLILFDQIERVVLIGRNKNVTKSLGLFGEAGNLVHFGLLKN